MSRKRDSVVKLSVIKVQACDDVNDERQENIRSGDGADVLAGKLCHCKIEYRHHCQRAHAYRRLRALPISNAKTETVIPP
ncbi:hypothetical protein D3C77_738070 [compost metagenome]